MMRLRKRTRRNASDMLILRKKLDPKKPESRDDPTKRAMAIIVAAITISGQKEKNSRCRGRVREQMIVLKVNYYLLIKPLPTPTFFYLA